MSYIEELLPIADALAKGIDSLLQQLERQKEIEQDLRNQLAKSNRKFSSNTSENPSSSAISERQDEIGNQTNDSGDRVQKDKVDRDKIYQAREAFQYFRMNMAKPAIPARKCPVAHHKTDHSDMEQDFTTQGKPSSLECPFANMNGDSNGLDPIAAEFHPEKSSAQSVGSGTPCKVCPIRFLDKHSPEEVAQYFENHKHEIPRSHEICVKRYQQNETSIRQLDAKYGNLVNMIQGLGSKHKAYLPADEVEESNFNEKSSNQAVHAWAEDVENTEQAIDTEREDQPRISHFDKPLREVRVGESPSRPWGISVPLENQAVASVTPPKIEIEDVAGKTKPALADTPIPMEQPPTFSSSQRLNEPQTPQIVFNGPVFIGYSADQAAQFLQQLGVVSPRK